MEARKEEQKLYDSFKEVLKSKAFLKGCIADAEWVDGWLRFILCEYESVLTGCRESRPSKNINFFLLRERNQGGGLIINTTRGAYLLEFQFWEALRGIYGSNLTLIQSENHEIRAFFQPTANPSIGSERQIINLIDLDRMKTDYMPVELKKEDHNYTSGKEILEQEGKLRRIELPVCLNIINIGCKKS